MKNKNKPRRTKAKKPTRHKPFNPWVYKYFKMTEGYNEMEKFTINRCPNCKVQIYRPALSKHCDNCGQALDWSGVKK